jgi:hypothetical protein
MMMKPQIDIMASVEMAVKEALGASLEKMRWLNAKWHGERDQYFTVTWEITVKDEREANDQLIEELYEEVANVLITSWENDAGALLDAWSDDPGDRKYLSDLVERVKRERNGKWGRINKARGEVEDG